MAIRVGIWKIGNEPIELPDALMSSEQLLEDMIVASP